MLLDVVQPDYTIKAYTDTTYGLIRFVRGAGVLSIAMLDKELQVSNDEKLNNNFSRAKSMVKQYGLCNPWDWFFTGTLDKEKYDRGDLNTYKDDLMQFVRDQRKKWKCKLKVLFVPEAHKDGSWHMHGMIYDLPEEALSKFKKGRHPRKLVEAGFLNWDDYAKKFGFCSMARIREPVGCALYLVKYVSKDVSKRAGDLGAHLYIPSRPLKKAVPVANVYGSRADLDKYLTYNGQFCSTGMVYDADWQFPFKYGDEFTAFPDGFEPPYLLEPEEDFKPETVDIDYEQVKMEGWRR